MWPINVPKQTPQQNEYAAKLYARIGEAAFLRRAKVKIGDWTPSPKECHANATAIHLHDSAYTPVRGWLYFDFHGLIQYVQFLAHSAVRTPNGELWDVTPVDVSVKYPFLVATEPEEDYAAIVEGGTIRLWHRK